MNESVSRIYCVSNQYYYGFGDQGRIDCIPAKKLMPNIILFELFIDRLVEINSNDLYGRIQIVIE